MKQPKKIFTRMLINNWGGIEHQMIYFHEYVNLFSGKSGSGKSTVMDAMQVVLYGSVRNDFFNKAADDTKNKRSVLSYLRGAQKDGTANRENQDFYSHIVLEILDTGKKNSVCVGVVFEVAKTDQDLKKYSFFSHTGKMPTDEYLSQEGIPYSYKQIQKLIQEKGKGEEGKGRSNLNRMYPSQDSYLNTLHDVIFGYVDAGRFKTMEKSAIALRMTNGTGQFIKDYMFPRSKEDTISAISEQLAAYREIKEQVETLEKEIAILEEVSFHNKAMIQAQGEQIITERLLKHVEIQDNKVKVMNQERKMEVLHTTIANLETKEQLWKKTLEEKREQLSQVQVELKSSEYQRKKEQLKQLQEVINLCSNEASDWRELTHRLKQWENTEGISDYVSNPICHLLQKIAEGEISEEKVEKLKRGLNEVFDTITEELGDINDKNRQIQKEYQAKKEMLADLKSDKKHYRKELTEVRRKLQQALSAKYGRTISVEVLADLFDVTDEEWRNAIEGRLGRMKFGLVVEPRYALEAANLFRQMKKAEYQSVDVINTAAIQRDKPQAEEETLYDAVKTETEYVDLCLKRYLGHVKKCNTVEELHEVKDGVTKDCYSYNNYMFRHLRQKDYKYQTIGRKISPKQIQDLEEDIAALDIELIALSQEIHTLKQVNNLERLQGYPYEKLVRLSEAGNKLKSYNQEADKLQQEIRELEKGTLVAHLREKETLLKSQVQGLKKNIDEIQQEKVNQAELKGNLKKDISEKKNYLDNLQEGFVPNSQQQTQAEQIVREGKVFEFKKNNKSLLEKLKQTEIEATELRGKARAKFIKEFPSFDFGGAEQENTLYDDLLEQCRMNFEPRYKEEFDKQYQLVYKMLRENVIATIHGEIKGAKRHRREINTMLSKIKFSDSIYQIDILPADDENRQFYEMLTAEELDMKVMNKEMEGQLCFGEDEFYQKYETQIRRLTEKFMPPRDGEAATRGNYKKDMEKYADYRTYLKFSMYEQVTDAEGNIKKNYVDDMAGRDSGGEGQNPKYVALLAGFAMLYMQQSSRDSKIRLVLLDEAFSKMDKERSEVCLHYARQLGLQLVVCVPDERLQSLIRNVDCVYGFRRNNNRISMIHIDKGDYFQMLEGEAK